jgi:hypothetical protein
MGEKYGCRVETQLENGIQSSPTFYLFNSLSPTLAKQIRSENTLTRWKNVLSAKTVWARSSTVSQKKFSRQQSIITTKLPFFTFRVCSAHLDGILHITYRNIHLNAGAFRGKNGKWTKNSCASQTFPSVSAPSFRRCLRRCCHQSSIQ